MEYYIDYNTGAGNEFHNTLAEAKAAADKGAAYTQKPITISAVLRSYRDNCITNSTDVARRNWYAEKFDPELYENGEESDVIQFGEFGHYGEWYDY